MATATMVWRGDREMKQRMGEYGQRVIQAVVAVANYWAEVLVTFSKDRHPWQDRTGNATQSLHSFVRQLSEDTVILYLSHGVEYGRWL
jgi:hypothetical protein